MTSFVFWRHHRIDSNLKMNPMDVLPPELGLYVFSFLDRRDLSRAALVIIFDHLFKFNQNIYWSLLMKMKDEGLIEHETERWRSAISGSLSLTTGLCSSRRSKTVSCTATPAPLSSAPKMTSSPGWGHHVDSHPRQFFSDHRDRSTAWTILSPFM